MTYKTQVQAVQATGPSPDPANARCFMHQFSLFARLCNYATNKIIRKTFLLYF